MPHAAYASMIGERISPLHVEIRATPRQGEQFPNRQPTSGTPRPTRRVPQGIELTPVEPVQQFSRPMGLLQPTAPTNETTSNTESEHGNATSQPTTESAEPRSIWQILQSALGSRFPATWQKQDWKNYLQQQDDEIAKTHQHEAPASGVVETDENTIFIVHAEDRELESPPDTPCPDPRRNMTMHEPIQPQDNEQPLWNIIHDVLGDRFPNSWYRQSWKEYFHIQDIVTGHAHTLNPTTRQIDSPVTASPGSQKNEGAKTRPLPAVPRSAESTPPQFRKSPETSAWTTYQSARDDYLAQEYQGNTVPVPRRMLITQDLPPRYNLYRYNTHTNYARDAVNEARYIRAEAEHEADTQKNGKQKKVTAKQMSRQQRPRVPPRKENDYKRPHSREALKTRLARKIGQNEPTTSVRRIGISYLERKNQILNGYAAHKMSSVPRWYNAHCSVGETYAECIPHREESLLPGDPTHDFNGRTNTRIGGRIISAPVQ